MQQLAGAKGMDEATQKAVQALQAFQASLLQPQVPTFLAAAKMALVSYHAHLDNHKLQ